MNTLYRILNTRTEQYLVDYTDIDFSYYFKYSFDKLEAKKYTKQQAENLIPLLGGFAHIIERV
jgi:hypothetical protein